MPHREDQIEDVAHHCHPLRQLPRVGHPERDARRGDLALGAGHTCRHRGLPTRKAAAMSPVDTPQTRRSVRATCDSRARAGWHAGEDQPQPIVRMPRRAVVRRSLADEQRKPAPQRRIPPQHVSRTVGGDRRQPGTGTIRDAAPRPHLDGPRERLLRALLGEVQVAGETGRRRDDRRPLGAVRIGESGVDLRGGNGR